MKLKLSFYKTVVLLVLLHVLGCNTVNNLPCSGNLLFPAVKGGKYCYINNKGAIVIPPLYNEAGDFYCNRAIVKVGEKYGVINQHGDFIFKPTFQTPPMRFFDGLSVINQASGNKIKYVFDKSGRLKFSLDCKRISPFIDFIASFKANNNKYGYVNSEGQIIIKPQFDNAGYFSEGKAMVSNNKKWGYVDTKGNLIIPYIYDDTSNFYNNQAVVSIHNHLKLINSQNDIIYEFNSNVGEIYPSYDDLWPAYNRREKKFGFFSISKKKWIIKPIYDYVYFFHEGLAIVEKNDKYGAIDKKGNVILPIKYDGFGGSGLGGSFNKAFKSGIIRVYIDVTIHEHKITKIGYINKKGKYIWSPVQKAE